LWFTGIVGAVSVGTKYSLNFANRESVETQQSFAIAPNDILILDAKSADTYRSGIRPDHSLTGTSMNQVYIIQTAKSNGPTAREAKRFAENLSYGIRQNGTTLTFDNHFSIKEGDPFRDQSVKLEIEIPKEVKFQFTRRYLDAFGYPWSIRNAGFNYAHSRNNIFIINIDNEIKCLNCPEADPYENVELNFEDEAFGRDFENWESRVYNKTIKQETRIEKIEITENFRVLLVKADSASVDRKSVV